MADLSIKCQKILADYKKEVDKDLDEVIKKATRAAAKQVRDNAASSFGGSGKYAKGWGATFEEAWGHVSGVVHNKSLPGLPHLLENGHAKRGGGRVPGRIHIAPVEDELNRTIIQELKNKL